MHGTATTGFRWDHELSFEENRENLRGFVRNSLNYFGLTWEELAAEANLSYSTVRNFGDGTTMQPHLSTGRALEGVFIRFERVYQRYQQTLAPPAAETIPVAQPKPVARPVRRVITRVQGRPLSEFQPWEQKRFQRRLERRAN